MALKDKENTLAENTHGRGTIKYTVLLLLYMAVLIPLLFISNLAENSGVHTNIITWLEITSILLVTIIVIIHGVGSVINFSHTKSIMMNVGIILVSLSGMILIMILTSLVKDSEGNPNSFTQSIILGIISLLSLLLMSIMTISEVSIS